MTRIYRDATSDLPRVQVIDDEQGFSWRMVLGEGAEQEASDWYSYYEGILRHKFKDGRVFMVVTAYFADELIPELTAVELKAPPPFPIGHVLRPGEGPEEVVRPADFYEQQLRQVGERVEKELVNQLSPESQFALRRSRQREDSAKWLREEERRLKAGW